MIKNIIFDLGNVILEQKTVNADFYFAEILNISNKNAKEFYKNYRKKAVSGLISFYELTKLFKEKFNSSKSIDEIINRYKKLYINDVYRVNQELIDLIKQLRNKYATYIMTNTLEPHYDHWKTFNLESYFNKIFRSDVDHFIKPEQKAYLFILKKIKAKPEECVFIDDLEGNVTGAIKSGLKGILYKNIKLLKKDMDKINVKI